MITALDPVSRVARSFADPDVFVSALAHGFIPILSDNSPAKVHSFEGGYLVQGAPLNVWFRGAWYEGQQEILAPFWESGQIDRPPAGALELPVVQAPPDVLASYANYKGVPQAKTLTEAYQGTGGLSSLLSSPLVLLAAGGLALYLFAGAGGRSRGRSEGAGSDDF